MLDNWQEYTLLQMQTKLTKLYRKYWNLQNRCYEKRNKKSNKKRR